MPVSEVIELLNWVATGLCIIGFVLSIKKDYGCYLFWLISGSYWVFYYTYKGMYPQVILCFVTLPIFVAGLISWIKDEKNGSGR